MNINKEIAWVTGLTQLKQDDKHRLVALHRELFGQTLDFCTECPDQVRIAVKRIIQYGKNIK